MVPQPEAVGGSGVVEVTAISLQLWDSMLGLSMIYADNGFAMNDFEARFATGNSCRCPCGKLDADQSTSVNIDESLH